jgi:hypothetical protein
MGKQKYIRQYIRSIDRQLASEEDAFLAVEGRSKNRN